jgi:hypothetical protein
MRPHTAITVGLGRELRLLTLVVMSCGVSGPAVDANWPAASPARAPAVCAATGQRPGQRGVRRPAMIDPAAYRGPYSYVARDATIRLLAKAPLTYQVIDPGARASGPSEISSTAPWTFAWGAPGATAQAAAALDQLEFGDIVNARFLAPDGVFNSEPPPAVLASLSRGTALPADPPLVAEWRQGYEPVVSVYADGHAFVSQRSDLIDVTLSADEFDGLLQAFATAGFDALPAGEPAPADAVILACERYQQVDVANYRRVLAPVLAAFARIADRGIAMARPLLMADKRGWHAEVLAWPADAPPVDALYNLRSKLIEHPTAVDASSPVFRALPDYLVAAFPAARPWPVVVSDRGQRWELFEHGCDRCRPGTYSAIYAQHVTFQEAPAWLPDLASIGPAGLVVDGLGSPGRSLLKHGAYRQRGEVYIVHVKRVIPPAP